MNVVIKTLPPSKNQYKDWHWAKKRRYFIDIEWEIWAEMLSQNCRPKRAFKKAEITFRLYFKTDAKRDAQNFIAGGLTEVIDSLVDLKVIKDDNYKVIGCPKVELYIDKKNPRMEIIVKEG